jgi:hypothetical protein
MNDQLSTPLHAAPTGAIARVLVQRMVRAIWRETRQYGYAVALGASLAIVGIYFWQWQYWAVFIPTMIGVLLRPNAPRERRAGNES